MAPRLRVARQRTAGAPTVFVRKWSSLRAATEVQAAYHQVCGEVPGSPIFIMKLSTNSRHLEAQLLADEYGDFIALNGRDCSVQRHHQKIIEEGPPVAPPPHLWKQMEDAAVSLTKAVGYANAGTVESLHWQAHRAGRLRGEPHRHRLAGSDHQGGRHQDRAQRRVRAPGGQRRRPDKPPRQRQLHGHALFVGAVEIHLAAYQGRRVWLDGAIVGAVEAHLAADRGHWVWLDGAVVGAIEAHLAAVDAVAKDVGCCGRVWLGLQRPTTFQVIFFTT